MKIKSILIAIGALVGVSSVAQAVAPMCTLTIENATNLSLSSNFPENLMIAPKHRALIGHGNFLVPCSLPPTVIKPIGGINVRKIGPYTPTGGIPIVTPVANTVLGGPGYGPLNNVTLRLEGHFADGSPQRVLNCSQYGGDPFTGYLDNVYGQFSLCIPVKGPIVRVLR